MENWGIIKMVNNMNDKGFTLVELIVTIGIIAMLGLVIGTNMVGIFSKEEDQAYNNFVKEIEEAGCMFVETGYSSSKRQTCKTSGTCIVTVDEMISRGYIDENLKDPNTGALVTSNKSNYGVRVQWVNNVKTCSMVGKE